MAWTTPRTWTDGELVTKAIMDVHVRDNLNALGPHFMIMKTADQIVNNSTTLVNDTHLVLPVGTSQVWKFEMSLLVSSTTAADWKCGWTVPAGTTMKWGEYEFGGATRWLRDAANSAVGDSLLTESTGLSINTSATPFTFAMRGFIFTSSTSGNVTFQWAQGAATAVDTKVLLGSCMEARRGI